MSRGHSRGLVLVSLETWDDVWRRNQYLLAGLLERDPDLRVLFVEPPVDMTHELVTRRRLARGRGVRVHPGYHGRLTLLEPTKVLPRVAGPAADAVWRRQVVGAASRLGMSDPMLWVNDPLGAELVRTTGWPALYDITDDWLAADRPARIRRRLEEHEELLLDRCADVVVCSPALAASRGARRTVQLIPNAVDVARYRQPAARPADLPGRTALYVGTLHEDRLDVDLVVETARSLGADGAVVLLGPDALADTSRAALQDAGVVLLGARPFDRIPAYLQHADVLIVPHVVDDFTDSLDPIKLYEYLAVGRPVVSTPVAGFRDAAGDSVTVAARDSFPDDVRRRVSAPGPTVQHPGVPDWAERVDAMAAVLRRVGGSSTARADN